jgi:hypothetical protein
MWMTGRVVAGLILLVASVAGAQQQAPVNEAATAPAFAVAPVPGKIYSARKVFISNAGSDSGLFPHPFSGDPDRPYNQFFANVQAMGRYTIVADPAQADLVLELQLSAPSGPQSPNKQNGASDPLPMFRLVIYDAPTHYVLWALTESIDPANLQKTHDKNFDQALANLVEDFKRVGTPVAPGQ